MAVTVAGVSSILLYFYFRDSGREITWKEFVHRYLGRGMVRSSTIRWYNWLQVVDMTTFSKAVLRF